MYGNKRKLFINISEMLKDCSNIESLLDIKDCFRKCCSQQGIQEKFTHFLDACLENGTAESIKNQISQDEINAVNANSNVHTLLG